VSAPVSYTGPDGDDLTDATIKMLVYSHPGEGKTVFWSTGGERVLFINSDPEGTISGSAQGNSFHKVDAFDWDDMENVYDWLKGDQPKGFKWIVWDSLTLFQDAVLIDDVMPEAVAQNPNQDEFVPSRREYLINMNRLGRMVRQLMKLPYNVGISAHVMTTTESGGDGTIFMPQVQGKNMPSKVAGYCNVVGYLTKEKESKDSDKVVQRLRTMRQGRIYAKDRWNALGTHVDKPTLPKVEGLIEAKRRALIAAKTKSGTVTSASPAPAPRSAAARARAAAATA
jgi:hypothetical protein